MIDSDLRLKRTWWISILVFTGLVGLCFHTLPFCKRIILPLELVSYDFRYRYRPAHTLDKRIVLIAIDEQSVDKIGRWPWDRSVHSRLLNKLLDSRVKVVGFDISFDGDARGDSQFAQAIDRSSDQVVLARFYSKSSDGSLRPHKLPRALSKVIHGTRNLGSPGLYLAASDPDGVVRRLPLINVDPDWPDPNQPRLRAFSLLLLEHFLNTNYHAKINSRTQAQLGPITLPVWGVPRHGRPANWILINYPTDLPQPISYVDVLEGNIPASKLQDKLIIVGSTVDFVDTCKIPPAAAKVPGYIVHASVIDTILNRRFILYYRKVTWWIGCTLSILFLLSAWRLKLKPSILSWICLTTAFLLTSWLIFIYQSIYIEVALPSLMLLCSLAGTLFYDLGQVRRVLGRFVPQSADIDSLVLGPEHAAATQKTRIATVLFVDVRDYTKLSEKFEAAEVRKLVGRFHLTTAEVFSQYGGEICDFQGDAQMVVFLGLGKNKNHALAAMKAARALKAQVNLLNRQLAQELSYEPEEIIFRYGVGICTGEVSIGYLQGGGRLQYTVLGDTTNTAARLQGKARDLGVSIVVSHTTVEAAGVDADQLPLLPLPPVTLKGKAKPLPVFQLED